MGKEIKGCNVLSLALFFLPFLPFLFFFCVYQVKSVASGSMGQGYLLKL